MEGEMAEDVLDDDTPVADGDQSVDDVDDGTDPDVDEPTTDTDSDDAADDSDGDDDQAATDEPDDPDAKPKATATGRSAKAQKLLDKYGGDEDKMVDAYFQQANSMSRLHQELQEIKEKLSAKADDPEAEAKYVANDSEVKEYAQDLQSLDNEIKQNQAAQTEMVAQFGKLEKNIAKLEGQLEKAAIEDRQEIRESLSEAKRDMNNLTREWKDAQREARRLDQQIRSAARQYRTAEAAAKARRQNDIQRESDRAQAQHVTQQEFLTTIENEAGKYGLKPNTKTYEIVADAVKERIVSVLRSMPKGSPAINLPAAVSQLMEEYAEALELKRFSKVSKQKVQGQPKITATGKPDTRSAQPKLDPKSAEYWRQRARRLAG